MAESGQLLKMEIWVHYSILSTLVSIGLENFRSKKKTSPNASLDIQPFLIITTYHNTTKSKPGNRDRDNSFCRRLGNGWTGNALERGDFSCHECLSPPLNSLDEEQITHDQAIKSRLYIF